jgi:hypothetical protein
MMRGLLREYCYLQFGSDFGFTVFREPKSAVNRHPLIGGESFPP